jgi:hypothetical protein
MDIGYLVFLCNILILACVSYKIKVTLNYHAQNEIIFQVNYRWFQLHELKCIKLTRKLFFKNASLFNQSSLHTLQDLSALPIAAFLYIGTERRADCGGYAHGTGDRLFTTTHAAAAAAGGCFVNNESTCLVRSGISLKRECTHALPRYFSPARDATLEARGGLRAACIAHLVSRPRLSA